MESMAGTLRIRMMSTFGSRYLGPACSLNFSAARRRGHDLVDLHSFGTLSGRSLPIIPLGRAHPGIRETMSRWSPRPCAYEEERGETIRRNSRFVRSTRTVSKNMSA